MNTDKLITFLILFVTSYAYGADLKKLRDWPPQTPVHSQELKRQYEYDPAAGAISNKLTSISTTFSYGTRVASSSRVEFRNSQNVSGGESAAYGLTAYHTFVSIMTSPQFKTQKVKFSQSTPWPANEFKIYTEYVHQGVTTKNAMICRKAMSFNATNIFPKLPGHIYRYDCDTTSGTITDGFTIAPDAHLTKYYYSDYLDAQIFADTGFDFHVMDGIQGMSNSEIGFIDSSGQAQKIQLNEAEMRIRLSQQ